jgi:hypothetical protein
VFVEVDTEKALKLLIIDNPKAFCYNSLTSSAGDIGSNRELPSAAVSGIGSACQGNTQNSLLRELPPEAESGQ